MTVEEDDGGASRGQDDRLKTYPMTPLMVCEGWSTCSRWCACVIKSCPRVHLPQPSVPSHPRRTACECVPRAPRNCAPRTRAPSVPLNFKKNIPGRPFYRPRASAAAARHAPRDASRGVAAVCCHRGARMPCAQRTALRGPRFLRWRGCRAACAISARQRPLVRPSDEVRVGIESVMWRGLGPSP